MKPLLLLNQAGQSVWLDNIITEQLQSDGIAAFARSYEQLLDALDQKRRVTHGAAT